MINIFDELERLKKYVQGKDLCLFLDYDGTLAPIAERPEEAALAPAVKALLRKLATSRRCFVYIISGRSLKDIKNVIGLSELGYIGNHGFETDLSKAAFKNFNFDRTKDVMGLLREEIKKAILHFKGAFVEDKGLTLSVHYRMVDARFETSVYDLLFEITKPYVERGEVAITLGKKVFEIRPPIDWDKGQSVLWILDEHQRASGKMPAAVYIGDDRTDEDAFRALKGKGIMIKVGPGRTIAEYHVPEQIDVVVLLNTILGFRQRGWLWRLIKR